MKICNMLTSTDFVVYIKHYIYNTSLMNSTVVIPILNNSEFKYVHIRYVNYLTKEYKQEIIHKYNENIFFCVQPHRLSCTIEGTLFYLNHLPECIVYWYLEWGYKFYYVYMNLLFWLSRSIKIIYTLTSCTCKCNITM